VSPLRGEKPQNWPLSKLNTGRFALRAMLPVITLHSKKILTLSTFTQSLMVLAKILVVDYLISLVLGSKSKSVAPV